MLPSSSSSPLAWWRNQCWSLGWSLDSPGWIALRADANSLQDSTGPQLLHHPPGVVPRKNKHNKTSCESRNSPQTFLDASGFAQECPSQPVQGENIAGSYALERELFIVGLDAADVVWGGGVQRFHQQRQRAAELRAAAESVRNRETRLHLWPAETLSKHAHLISH